MTDPYKHKWYVVEDGDDTSIVAHEQMRQLVYSARDVRMCLLEAHTDATGRLDPSRIRETMKYMVDIHNKGLGGTQR